MANDDSIGLESIRHVNEMDYIKELKTEIRTLEASVNSLKNEKHIIENELQNSKNENMRHCQLLNEKCQKADDDFNGQKRISQHLLVYCSNLKSDHEKQIKELESHQNLLLKENRDSSNKLLDSQNHIESLTKEKENLEESLRKQESQTRHMEKEKETLSKCLKEQEETLQTIGKIRENEKADFSSELKAKRELLDKTIESEVKAREELKNSKATIEHLKKEIEAEKKKKDNKSELSRVNERNKQLERELMDLKQELGRVNERNKQLEKELVDLTQERNRVNERNKQLEKELVDLNKVSSERIDNINSEKKTLLSELSATKGRAEDWKKANDGIKNTLTEKQQEIQRLQKVNEGLQDQLSSTTQECENLKKKITQFKTSPEESQSHDVTTLVKGYTEEIKNLSIKLKNLLSPSQKSTKSITSRRQGVHVRAFDEIQKQSEGDAVVILYDIINKTNELEEKLKARNEPLLNQSTQREDSSRATTNEIKQQTKESGATSDVSGRGEYTPSTYSQKVDDNRKIVTIGLWEDGQKLRMLKEEICFYSKSNEPITVFFKFSYSLFNKEYTFTCEIASKGLQIREKYNLMIELYALNIHNEKMLIRSDDITISSFYKSVRHYFFDRYNGYYYFSITSVLTTPNTN